MEILLHLQSFSTKVQLMPTIININIHYIIFFYFFFFFFLTIPIINNGQKNIPIINNGYIIIIINIIIQWLFWAVSKIY